MIIPEKIRVSSDTDAHTPDGRRVFEIQYSFEYWTTGTYVYEDGTLEEPNTEEAITRWGADGESLSHMDIAYIDLRKYIRTHTQEIREEILLAKMK